VVAVVAAGFFDDTTNGRYSFDHFASVSRPFPPPHPPSFLPFSSFLRSSLPCFLPSFHRSFCRSVVLPFFRSVLPCCPSVLSFRSVLRSFLYTGVKKESVPTAC
jgi:hypothetical protein